MQTIASETGLSVSAVQRSLRKLKKVGCIRYEGKGGYRQSDGKGIANDFKFLMPNAAAKGGTKGVIRDTLAKAVRVSSVVEEGCHPWQKEGVIRDTHNSESRTVNKNSECLTEGHETERLSPPAAAFVLNAEKLAIAKSCGLDEHQAVACLDAFRRESSERYIGSSGMTDAWRSYTARMRTLLNENERYCSGHEQVRRREMILKRGSA